MKAIAVFLVLLFFGALNILTPVSVHAAQRVGWTINGATITQNVPFSDSGDGCSGHIEDVLVADWNSENSACMNDGSSMNIGYISVGGSYYELVGFPFSKDVHLVDGMCAGPLCNYVPDKDMLVTTVRTDSGASNIEVFLHISSRIKQAQSYPGVVQYMFDWSNPDYILSDIAGHSIPTGAFTVSNNGDWVVAELINKGLALINTSTFVVQQIEMNGYRYGQGLDPSENLAVSDDGVSIALTGRNAGFQVIDVVSGCGQKLAGDLTTQQGKSECPSNDLEIGNISQGFLYGENPEFFGEGHELQVVVYTPSQETRLITFLEVGTDLDHKIALLALGDSFTSGEGETDFSFYEPGTNDVFDTCHLSRRSYPFLIGQALGIADKDVRSVACAGATTKDIVGSEDSYWGQGGRLGQSKLDMPPPSKTTAQEAAVDSFQPGRVLQSVFLSHYSPKIVTVGIGGNDAGLMGKLSSCAMPGTCEWAQGDGIRATANEIKGLFGTLTAFYHQLSLLSSSTKFYAVGYPDVIDANGVCDPLTDVLLDHEERVFIDQSLQYLNQIIRTAAEQEGFTYLDVEHSLDGKRLCDGLNSTAMNGLRWGGDISVISALPMLKIIGAGTFHPTPVGHALIADTILAGHPDLQQDAKSTSEPDIEPPAYWNPQDTSSQRQSYVTDFVQKVNDEANMLSVTIPAGVLQALSSITVEVHSDALSLGTFTANSDGSVLGKLTLPANLESGVHTIHLYGINREGLPVDLYQFLVIGESGQVFTASVNGDTGTTLSPQGPHVKGTSKTWLNNLTGVLGVSDTASHSGAAGSIFTKPTQLVERILNDSDFIWIVVIAGISVLSSTLCIFLVLRRWAKHGS